MDKLKPLRGTSIHCSCQEKWRILKIGMVNDWSLLGYKKVHIRSLWNHHLVILRKIWQP